MHIHWFPGHMTKSLRLIAENIKSVDAVVYILDARAPLSCLNESLDEIIKDKSVLYVLNKKDLADANKIKSWLQKFESLGKNAVTLSGTERGEMSVLLSALKKIEKPKVKKFEQKGAFVPTRIMVVGVPNCGKSTVINTLCGKKSAVTGDKPGVTRGKQWVKLQNGMELLDTPGTLFPDFSNQTRAKHLAFIGSIKDEVVDPEELARELISCLAEKYPIEFTAKYGLSNLADVNLSMDEICKKRGCVIRGGEFDYERGAKALIDDFRKGKICKVTLEDTDESFV